ncbi:hypothetical protein [Roseiflexus sp.]|uniref:hypothetical protein n=1 Tax=Roseiflexus sp. TaxID=2562120 RepID=UPI00398B770B
MAEKKSKTDVTARDKSGRVTNRYCNHCGQRIMNDRDMVVITDGRRRNKTYYRRDCFNRLVGTDRELGLDGAQTCPLR